MGVMVKNKVARFFMDHGVLLNMHGWGPRGLSSTSRTA